MSKPINPYITLKGRFSKFVDGCILRNPKVMWIYPKEKLSSNWSLKDLYERTAAAKQLGFDVQISAEDEGLVVKYLKQLPSRPWDI
jgi:hypothetical protein